MTRSRVFNVDAPAVETRSRTRPTDIPQDVLDLAQTLYDANKRKNAASAAEAKVKKELHKKMTKGGIKSFDFVGSYEGATTPMVAVIEPTVDSVVSVSKLRSLLDDETFMRVISATKGAVKEIAGDDILMQTEEDVTKPPSLKMKKAD